MLSFHLVGIFLSLTTVFAKSAIVRLHTSGEALNISNTIPEGPDSLPVFIFEGVTKHARPDTGSTGVDFKIS